ncbi:MAG: hypothetical protein A2236_04340 [Bacteroidetes bacterium RIFOXYA2_FULL_33_7]|nr:MAG: hypothetical protein A2236_04340 [Bacteroidetes bacterium RIFOXYA2_FULL_33_7]
MSGTTSVIDINGGSITGTDAGSGNDITLICTGTLTTLQGSATSNFDHEKKFHSITVNASKTLALSRGILCRYGTFAVNGTLKINENGYVQNGVVSFATPTYGASATLYYNVGSAYNSNTEWSSPPNVTIDNNSNITLNNGSKTISGTLALTSGILTLGSNDLTLTSGASVSGTFSSSNMIIATSTGKLKKNLIAIGSYSFPVGSIGEYTPIALNFTVGSFSSAWVGVNLTATKHADNTSTTNYLERYWTVDKFGITSFSCEVTCTYVTADIVGTETSLYGARRESSSYWEILDVVDDGANQFSGTVVNFGDFTCGEQDALSWQTFQDGDWNTVSTWVANSVPPEGSNVMIKHAVTLNAAANNVGLLTIQTGKSLTTLSSSATLTVSGAVNINGTLNMTNGGVITIGNGGYITNNGTFTRGTGKIYFSHDAYVNGANHIDFNDVTVNADVNFGAGVSTVYGILEILSAGFIISNSPSLASTSTLKYNIGGQYNRVIEWNNPANLWVTGNTHLDMNSTGVDYTASGNVTIDVGSVIDMQAMTTRLIVGGNVSLGGELILSSAVGGDLEVKGHWSRTGTLTTNGRLVTFNGTTNQNINNHTTFDYITIDNSGGVIVTLIDDIVANTNLNVTTDAILNLSTRTVTGTGTFNLNSIGTIKIGSIDGITTTGTASGNIQVSGTRTYAQDGIYHYIASANQVSGNGLPTTINSGGKVIIELNATPTTFTPSSSVSISSGAELKILEGTLVEDGAGTIFSGAGNLTMSGGIYKFLSTVTLPTSATVYPRLTGTYAITGGTIELATDCNTSSTFQILKGADRTYFNVKFSGGSSNGGYKLVSSACVITNQLQITDATTIFDMEANGITGDGGLVMDGGKLRMSKVSTALPELTGINSAYSLTGGTVEFYGSDANQQQRVKGSYGSGPTEITYYNLELNSDAANLLTSNNGADAGNIDINSSFNISNAITINSPTVFRMDETDNIAGTGNFDLSSGATLLFGSPNGIKTSGTGVSDGNIRVSGTRTFPTDASYGFISDGSMNVGNGLPATVSSLYVYKTTSSDEISLAQSTIISNQLSLLNGKISTGNFIVTVDNITPANVIDAGTNNFANSYIVGNLTRKLPNSSSNSDIFYFPIGVSANPRLMIYENTNLEGVTYLNAKFSTTEDLTTGILNVTESGTPINSICTEGIWKIEPTGLVTSGSYGIKLYFDGFTSLSASNDNKFTILKRPTASTDLGDFTNGNGTISANDGSGRMYDDGYAYKWDLASFSQAAIGKSSIVLPIELIEFYAKKNYNIIDIFWTTASELNNDYFSLEKSVDAINFLEIYKTNGQGNSSSINYYQTQDYDISNNNYYRLKQVDFDGKYSYSDIISIQSWDENITIFNNKIFLNEKYPSSIRIYDVLGRIIFEKKNITETIVDIEQIGIKTNSIIFVSISNKKINITKKHLFN